MAGRKHACRVNRIIRIHAVEQRGKKVQLIRAVILFKYIPCRQREMCISDRELTDRGLLHKDWPGIYYRIKDFCQGIPADMT